MSSVTTRASRQSRRRTARRLAVVPKPAQALVCARGNALPALATCSASHGAFGHGFAASICCMAGAGKRGIRNTWGRKPTGNRHSRHNGGRIGAEDNRPTRDRPTAPRNGKSTVLRSRQVREIDGGLRRQLTCSRFVPRAVDESNSFPSTCNGQQGHESTRSGISAVLDAYANRRAALLPPIGKRQPRLSTFAAVTSRRHSPTFTSTNRT